MKYQSDDYVHLFVAKMQNDNAGRVEDFVLNEIAEGRIKLSEKPSNVFSRYYIQSLSYAYGLSERIGKETFSDRDDSFQLASVIMPFSEPIEVGYSMMMGNVRRGS